MMIYWISLQVLLYWFFATTSLDPMLISSTSRGAEFQNEFGSPTSQYWIGLNRLHAVSQNNCPVRFDLQLTSGSVAFAIYSTFSVGNSSTNYTLTVGGCSGDAGDAMRDQAGQQFTTYDVDNDRMPWGNCAQSFSGGFWYNSCVSAGITVSPETYFYWYGDSSVDGLLSSVEVNLLC